MLYIIILPQCCGVMVIPYFLIQLFGIFDKVHFPWLKVILRNEQEVDIIVS